MNVSYNTEDRSLLEVPSTSIDSFLKENRRKMVWPEYYYGIDNNQQYRSEFTDDRLKVLIVMLSTGDTRSQSNTFNALNHLATKDLGTDKVFVDFCYFPEKANMDMLTKAGIPWIFGNVSHETCKHYDVIYMSNAIIPEVANISHMYKHSGIPLTIEERDKEDIPLVVFGGAAASEANIALGPIYNDDGTYVGKSLIDIANYGYGEVNITKLTNKLYELKMAGMNLHDKPQVKETLINEEFLKDYLFYPEHYQWVYDEKDHWTIKEIKCLDSRLPKRVLYNTIHEDFRGFPLRVMHLSGQAAHAQDIMVSSGCSGQSSTCSFCLEATLAGRYFERELPDIENEIKYARMTTAPNAISPYSFNLNYYKHFMDLISLIGHNSKTISMHNERVDVVANAPDQMLLAKKMGLMRFAGAIEGCSERIRNGLLNKNLSEETLLRAFDIIFDLKLMHAKCGMIQTGFETDEDFDEFIAMLDKLIEHREKKGASTFFQFNWTPLVYYNQIPLRWMARNTARMGFDNVRCFQKVIAACKERNCRIKFNSRGSGTWQEQMVLDLGPAGTDLLVHSCLEDGFIYISFFDDRFKDGLVKQLAKRGWDPYFFLNERPLDWIFPGDHIKFCSDELIEDWKKRHIEQNFRKPLCLRTPAKNDPKCYGCKACHNGEEIKCMIHRDVSDVNTVESVLESISSYRYVDAIRVVGKKNPDWDIYHLDSMCHYLTAQFLQRDPDLEDAFFAVGHNTHEIVGNNGQKAYFGGTFAFDVQLRKRVPLSKWTSLIEDINKHLTVAQIVNVFPDAKEVPVGRGTEIAWFGNTSSISMTLLKDKLANFDWNIFKSVKSMAGGLNLEKFPMPELKEQCLFVQRGSQVLVYMNLPCDVNPHLVMASILGRGYEKVLNDFNFNSMDQTKPVDAHGSDGRQLGFSLFKNQNKKYSNIMEGKMLLAKLTK